MDGDKDTVAVVVTIIGVLVFVGALKFFGQELGVPAGRQSTDGPMSQVELGKHLSRSCVPCHDLTSTRKLTRVGPPLWGIVGQPAASVSGYKYSRAQVKAGETGVVWDEQSLDSYLNDPKEFIPGNRMAFAGLRIDAERKALIDYLKTLRDKKESGMAP